MGGDTKVWDEMNQGGQIVGKMYCVFDPDEVDNARHFFDLANIAIQNHARQQATVKHSEQNRVKRSSGKLLNNQKRNRNILHECITITIPKVEARTTCPPGQESACARTNRQEAKKLCNQ